MIIILIKANKINKTTLKEPKMNKSEKYVASKFNKVTHCHDGVVIVNTLYGTSAKFTNVKDIKKIEDGILCLEYYPDNDSKLSEYLKEKNLLFLLEQMKMQK